MFKPFIKSIITAFILLGVVLAASATNKSFDKAGAEAMHEAGFDNLDINEDGAITKQEAIKSPAMIEVWGQIDKNADNVISMDEFKSSQL